MKGKKNLFEMNTLESFYLDKHYVYVNKIKIFKTDLFSYTIPYIHPKKLMFCVCAMADS